MQATRALEAAGERWSLLILRDAIFRGRKRFSEFQRSLGLATNVLAARLDRFVAEGLMEIRPAADHPDQHEYGVTEKGLDFADVVVALTAWGDKWDAPHGPPVRYRHTSCRGPIGVELRCSYCGALVESGDLLAEAGPGSRVRRRSAQPQTPDD